MLMLGSRIALISSLALITAPLAAQQVVPADERIVVTESTQTSARTTPAGISNLSHAEQPPGLRIDPAELLAGIAGVQSDSRANYAQDTRITLRGFGARSAFGVRGVLLLLDGIPLSMPDGQAQTSSIFLDEAENVQVIRGPLATLYGNSAGGVIDWRSQMPDQSRLQIDLLGGQNDTSRGVLQADYVSEQQALRLLGARLRSDGPRPQNRAERDQLALRWYRQLDATRQWIVRVDHHDAPLLQDPGSLTPAAWAADPQQTFAGATRFDTRKAITHQQVSFTLRDEQPELPWHVSFWYGSRDVEQYLPFTGAAPESSGAVIDLQRDFYGVDSAINVPVSASVQWTVGAQLAEQRDRRFGLVNDFGVRGALRRDERGIVRNRAAYSLWQWQPAERWQLVLGARYSQLDFQVEDFYINSNSGDDSGDGRNSAWSWNAGVNYQLNAQWQVYLARGRGFEAPTLTELAYSASGSGLNQTLGPAINQQWEAGLRWQADSSRGHLSVFDIATSNEIVVAASIDGRTIYTNAEQTTRRGIELEQRWQLSDTVDWRMAASYLSAAFSNGLRLPGVARETFYSQVNWHLGNWLQKPTELSIITDYRGKIAAFDDNSVFSPSHTLWHLSLSQQWQWQAWQVQPWLKVFNLTDRAYVGSVVVNQGSGRAFEPGVGREWQFGVRIQRGW